MIFRYFIGRLLVIAILVSCSEFELERIGFLKVVTVGISDLGTNSVTMVGTIEDLRQATVVESGFIISATNSDKTSLRVDQSNNLKVISEEQLKEGGVFLANYNDLESGATYFYRAFLKIKEEPAYAYGAIDSFITPQLGIYIESIERINSGCPTTADLKILLLSSGIEFSRLNYGIVWRNDVLRDPDFSDNVINGEDLNEQGYFSVELPIVDCNGNYSIRAFVKIAGNEIVFSKIKEFTIKPNGAPHKHPIRVEAGESCIVDLTQAYTITGTLSGSFEINLQT